MGVVVLPKTLTAKTEAKAADVMADLNALVTAVNGKLDLENLAESIRNALLPTGAVIQVALVSAPTGFLLCQGQEVSRTTYAALFAKIGTTFGAGNGTTTFNVPDLRGRTAVGVDAAAGRLTANNTLGAGAGEEKHTLTIGEIAAHFHNLNANTGGESATHYHTLSLLIQNGYAATAGGKTAYTGGGSEGFTSTEQGSHVHNINANTDTRGSGEAHNNMPPYTVLNYAIKT